MGDKFTKATGLTFAAFVALMVGLQWDSFFRAMAGFPALVQAWTAGMPFGIGSFLLAVALGMGVWGLAFRYWPGHCDRRPHFCADTTALVVGLMVMLTQQWGGTPAQMLTALWVGLLAGLMAPYLARAVWSFFAPPKDPPK